MTKRTIIGFLAAAALPAVVLTLLTPIGDAPINTDPLSVIGLLPIAYLWALSAAVFFGVPMFLLVRRLNMVRWWSAVGSGALVGAVVAVVIGIPNTVQTKDFLLMIPLGAAAALVFWAIWQSDATQPRAPR